MKVKNRTMWWAKSYLYLFFLALHLNILAQNVPWATPNKWGGVSYLQINCVPTVDGISLSSEDYIGVFNKQGICYGLTKYQDTTLMISISVSNGTVSEGFNNGDSMIFKVWLKNENCIIDNSVKVVSDQSMVYNSTYKTSSITELKFQKYSVNYPVIEVCKSVSELNPISNALSNSVFFTSSMGLSIDSLNGNIYPVKSESGQYEVKLNSKYCLVNNSLLITINSLPVIYDIKDTIICGDDNLVLDVPDLVKTHIAWSTGNNGQQEIFTKPGKAWYTVVDSKGCLNSDTFKISKMEILSLKYQIDKADCYQKGRLRVLNQEISNGRPPYIFKLKNVLDNAQTDDLNNLPEGIYSVDIANSNGCILKYPTTITVDRDCLNDKPVFSPNEDGLDDHYFLSFTGEIKIFDRYGALKRKLQGPCYFDGKDSNGKPLPMGTYLVVSQDNKNMTLTIVK